jgi:hypothetical protein
MLFLSGWNNEDETILMLFYILLFFSSLAVVINNISILDLKIVSASKPCLDFFKDRPDGDESKHLDGLSSNHAER